jgi:serine/threonine-protein kinase
MVEGKTETIEAGHVVGERFRIVELLGEGGIGQVYRAEHTELGTPFAVKVLRPELAGDETVAGRFKREALAVSRLRHPNIVFVTDFGRLEDGRLYLVMEHLTGKSLQDVLNDEGALPIGEALEILIQVAEGMWFAQQHNVIHRDLKPDNIMLIEERVQRRSVKIIDFGLAKMLDDSLNLLTAEGALPGTPMHMSPEQVSGRRADHRSDIYAFGITTYETLTRSEPFVGSIYEIMLAHRNTVPDKPSVRAPEAGIFPDLDDLVMRCLEKKPAERYQGFDEVLADLRACEGIART